MNKVDRIIKFLEDWERLPLAIVTMMGPWLTPLVPAYFVAVAINRHLQAPMWVSVIAGMILELVGIAGIAVTTRSYVWNRIRRKTDEPAQFILSLFAVSIYFVTALGLTVLLELFSDLAKIAPGMFVVMAVSSGLILVLSGMQNRREKAIESERREKRERRELSGNLTGNITDHGALTSNSTKARAAEILAQRPDISGAELARELGKSDSLGRKLKAELLPFLSIDDSTSTNGNGVHHDQ
jgi:hypothetical protein